MTDINEQTDTVHVEVDLSVCQNYGQCVFEAPEIFDFDDQDRLVFEPRPNYVLREKAEAAALACPVQAIRISNKPATPA